MSGAALYLMSLFVPFAESVRPMGESRGTHRRGCIIRAMIYIVVFSMRFGVKYLIRLEQLGVSPLVPSIFQGSRAGRVLLQHNSSGGRAATCACGWTKYTWLGKHANTANTAVVAYPHIFSAPKFTYCSTAPKLYWCASAVAMVVAKVSLTTTGREALGSVHYTYKEEVLRSSHSNVGGRPPAGGSRRRGQHCCAASRRRKSDACLLPLNSMLYLHNAMEDTLKSTKKALLWHDAGPPWVSLTYSWETTTGIGYGKMRDIPELIFRKKVRHDLD